MSKYYVDGEILGLEEAKEKLKLQLIVEPLGLEIPLEDELFDRLYREGRFISGKKRQQQPDIGSTEDRESEES